MLNEFPDDAIVSEEVTKAANFLKSQADHIREEMTPRMDGILIIASYTDDNGNTQLCVGESGNRFANTSAAEEFLNQIYMFRDDA